MKFPNTPGVAMAPVLAALLLVLPCPSDAFGQATVTWDGSGDMDWTQPDGTSWSGGTYQSGDHAQFLGAGAGTVNIVGTVTPGSVLVNSGANYTFAGGSIGGTASLTKSGTGLLELSGTNTFTGPITVNGGILRPTTESAIPTDPVINAGGTFDVNGLNFWTVNPRTFTIAGTGAAGTVGALTTTAGAPESQVLNVTLSDNATIGTSAGKLNIRGLVDGGDNILTIAGSGETNFRPSASLDNLAGIVIDTTGGGRLRFESDGGGGTLNPPSLIPITVNPGGRLDTWVSGANRTFGPNLVINLNGGILEANGSGNTAIWDGPVTVLADSTIHANQRIDFFGELSGPGVLTKSGGNIFAIRGGVAADLGGIVINQGTVRTENAGFGSWTGPVTVNPGGTLNSWGGQTRQVQINLNGGTLSSSGGGTHNWNGPVIVNADSTIAANDRIDIFGNVSGTGVITKTGGNILNFRGGISSLGGIEANSGRLRFESDITPVSPFTVSLNSGGVVDTWIAAGTRTMGSNVTLNLNGGTLETNGGGNHRWDGPVTVSSNSTINNGNRLDFFGNVTGTGVITKTGGGVLVFRGAGVTSMGGLQINGGRVRYEEGGFGAWTGPITVNAGGILSGWGNQTTQAEVNLNGGTLAVENNGTGTFNGAVNALSASTIDTGPGGIILNGPLNGPGNLSKVGSGVLQLNGTSTGYTGTLNVNAGVLRAANTNALPVNVNIASGATFDANGVNFGPRDITIAGTGASGFIGAWTNTGGGEGWIRNITLAGDATIGTNGAKINSNGIIDGGGNTLTIVGGGETNFRPGTQLTNLAGITVNTTGGGRLRLEGDINPASTQTITVQPGGRVDTWSNRTLGSNLALNLNGGILEAQGSGAPTTAVWNGPIQVSADSTVNTTGGGGSNRDITLAGPLSGSGNLNKTGPGILILTADNSGYDGNIQVGQGTMLVNNTAGTGSGSGGVTVLTSATLGGNGSLGGNTVIQSGGNLVAGGDPTSSLFGIGNLAFDGNLTLQPGSNTTMLLASAMGNVPAFSIPPFAVPSGENDFFSIDGTLAANGNLALVFDPSYTPVAGDYFILAEFGALDPGSNPNFILPALGPGLGWNGGFVTTSSGYAFAQITPEPGRALLLGLAGLLLMARRRRPSLPTA